MSKAIKEVYSGKALMAQQKKMGVPLIDFPSLRDEILSNYESVSYLRDKAKRGQDWEAQHCLSKAYEYGVPELNIEQDLDSAIGWLESSFRNGNDIDHEKCHLGALYDTRGTIPDQRRAFELYLESALAGVVQAQVNLAEIYRWGIEGVVYKDLEEAFKWFRRAADEEADDVGDQIDSPTLILKGTFKDLGIDFKIDALKKLNKYYMIGECPEGEPQPIKALYYLKKAAELGDSEAQKDLGLAYLKGKSGQPKDIDRAKRWLKKAASNGDQEAVEIIKKFDDQTIVDVADEPDELLQESSAKQYCELLKMTMARQERHSYVIKSPTSIEVNFEQFSKSPTAQRYKKASELLMKGLEKLGNWVKSDENLSTDNLDFEEGIKMLAQGMLNENSVVVSYLDLQRPDLTPLIQESIFKKLKTNPNFFEGLVVLFASYPLNRRFSAESCKIDLRRTMFLNNVIHLIKKAEPDMLPTQDPYSYDQNYSSWSHELYYFLGSNYIIAGCFKDGAEVFQKALHCCPTFSEAKLPLGSCLMEMSFKKQTGGKCAEKNQEAEDNPDELLLKRFAMPEYQRITKGDYRTWSITQLREKAKQLFMEYLREVPECDKMYPEGYYHLAHLCFIERSLEEALKWKEKGEEAEEKRLPFLPQFESALKELLRPLDLLQISKEHRKERNQKTGHVPCETGRPIPSVARQQDRATGKANEKERKTCAKCKETIQELKWCPCKKAFYCGSECQKEDWKEHKKICTSKKKKKSNSSQ